MKLEIIKKIIGIIGLLIALPWGPLAIAAVGLVTAPIGALVNAFPNIRLLGYGIREQFQDIFPSMLLAGVMGVVVYSISFFELSNIWILLLQVIIGMITYGFLSKIFYSDVMNYIIDIVVGLMKNKKG